MARHDADGNAISCPKCNSKKMRKDGFAYWKTFKRQRWLCNDCNLKTITPKKIAHNPFNVSEVPVEEMSIDDIIAFRNKKYQVKVKNANYKKLIPIKVNITGVIGIAHFGDPHVDDDGTNLAEIYDIVNKINKTEGMFAGNLGDVQNNWIGRLTALYGQQSTTAKESWLITEHFLTSVPWMYLVAGNHDVWSGDGDPIEFIMRDQPALYQKHGARMNLIFPNGRKIRVSARHQFKGNSMWNTAHSISKAIQMGWRDHILTAGHTHVSGYQVLKDPSSGLISHALQVASFKNMDEYAEKLGLDDKNIFNCPVTIIDPKYADDDRRLITTIFDPHEGADYLTWKRKKK